MNKLFRVLSICLLATAAAFAQQNVLTQTSLSTAVTSSFTTSIVVASATNIAVTSGTSNGAVLYVVDVGQNAGELMNVTSVSGTTIGVRRGMGGTKAVTHQASAMVLVGQPNYFYAYDPSGSCTAASTLVRPWVNVVNGRQWICSTVTGALAWVPGWQNTSAPPAATLTVASAASAILPSGPLFTVSGTAAITGFTIPVGFISGSFCTVPTGAFTWTTAGNIGLAGTAVVGRILCFTYDQSAAKFYPSYV